jgi:glycerol uptake facilitator-like aquaporin
MEISRAGRRRVDDEDVRAAMVEFGLTTAFMFAVFSLVRWGIGTMPPGAAPWELHLRVTAVSMTVGLIIVGFVRSRPGRYSGAHMNPAITLALYVFGTTSARRAAPYLVAQCAGSVAAAVLTRVVWGDAVSDAPVRWAVVLPGSGWTWSGVALVEAAVLAAIVGVLCWTTVRRPAWPVAWIVGAMFGVQGSVLGTLSGGSANPARQLGPALLSGQLHLLAVYLLAPAAGGMAAGWVARRLLTPSRAEHLVRRPPSRRPAAVPARSGAAGNRPGSRVDAGRSRPGRTRPRGTSCPVRPAGPAGPWR